MANIDYFSATSLHIETYFNDTYLASGTGFVVEKEGKNFLTTNWHVLSGRRPSDEAPISQTAAIPNRVSVWHFSKGRLDHWTRVDYSNVSLEGNLWVESRDAKGKIEDVAILEIPHNDLIDFHKIDLRLSGADIVVTPSEPVSIIGFPYGKSSDGKFPIWKTGHVASDLDINFQGNRAFLVDSSTKPGMSGSPVLARRVGMTVTSGGISMGGQSNRFMGIYSGRVQDEEKLERSNLGLVWKPSVLDDLLAKTLQS